MKFETYTYVYININECMMYFEKTVNQIKIIQTLVRLGFYPINKAPASFKLATDSLKEGLLLL